MTIDTNYDVENKTIKIHDKINNINFDTWLLYPSSDKSYKTKLKPNDMDPALNSKIVTGKFPMVLISHGGGGSHLLYKIVAKYLAENGYIVAMIEHHGNNRKDNHLEGLNENLTLRTKHVSLVIDTLLCTDELKDHIDPQKIFMIGHSMGGCTALAIAGAVPFSREREKIEVTFDKRVKALVLFAPATAWFQDPNSLKQVGLPIVIYSAEQDKLTPYWQAKLIKEGVRKSGLVDLQIVKNAGHLSFVDPFPKQMRNINFPPSQDPVGFDREAFHEILKIEVLNFLNKQQRNKIILD